MSSLPEWDGKRVSFRDAWGPILWWLNKMGFWAVPIPWPRIVYCLPGKRSHPTLIKHEMVHYRQMLRDGTVRWCIKYCWYAWKFGYWKNPYEEEAYGISGYADEE